MSVRLFLQGKAIVETTLPGPEGTSDSVSGVAERLHSAEPVEKRSTDVGLLDGATKVALTVGAAPAVDINGVEVAGLVVTEDPGGATPATETPPAETVELDKEVPVVTTNASKVVLTVGTKQRTVHNAQRSIGFRLIRTHKQQDNAGSTSFT